MDYPLSLATSLGLKDGRFTDGVPGLYAASINPSQSFNDVIDEILAVQQEGGVAKNEFNRTQLKTAIKNMIEARVGDFSIDTGALNACVVALNPVVTSSVGVTDVKFRIRFTNTDVCTLDVGFGPTPLKRDDGTALKANDLSAGTLVGATYDPTNSIFLINSLVAGQALSAAQFQSGMAISAIAAGTANALTAAFVPAISAAANQTLLVRAILANTLTNPTIDVGFAALTMVKGNNLPLVAGDIAGAGHWLEITLDQTLGKAVLQNPATGVVAPLAAPKILPISGTVAANALTLGLTAISLDFRSPALTSGAVNTRTIPAALSLTVPSGATLGTSNGVLSRLVLLAMDNAGVVELAVANISGGINLDETTLISTTAISAGATAANIAYSAVARTNLPFRVVGFIDSNQAAAGTWATAPSTLQGSGGQALAALSSLGYGQTWQLVTGSRAFSTTYYNTTGRPITVVISSGQGASGVSMSATINGIGFVVAQSVIPSGNASCAGSFIVPSGASYNVTVAGGITIGTWAELR